MEITEDQRQVRPVRVLKVWRQAGEPIEWVAQLSNGTTVGMLGRDELDVWRKATEWIKYKGEKHE